MYIQNNLMFQKIVIFKIPRHLINLTILIIFLPRILNKNIDLVSNYFF